jgi:multiple sugar transport system substrate-binding protein
MALKGISRRTLLKAGAGLGAGAMIFTPTKSRAQRRHKLVFWHVPNFTPLADQLQREQVFAYAKEAGLKESDVDYTVVSNSDFIPKMSAALETGTPPDVTRLYESYVQLYRSQGHLLDTTDVVRKMQKEKGGIYESSLEAVGYKGRYFGVPLAINPWPMHARLDLLEKAKVSYPKTWDEFVETCKKVQSPPFYGFGMCLGAFEDGTDNIMQVCWCFGGKTVDASGKVVFNSPANVKAFQFIADMYLKHKIIPQGAISWDNAGNNQAYQSKQVAFINNPASVYAYLAGNDKDLMDKTGLFGVPAGPAGAVNQIDTWSYGVFKKAPDPKLALGLAEYLMKPENYNKIITSTNGRWVPVYPRLFDDPFWTARPVFNEFKQIAKTGVPISYGGPPSPASGEVLSTHLIPRGMQRVLVDGVDAATAVADVHARIEEVYKRRAEA